jgi:hypothetical protein
MAAKPRKPSNKLGLRMMRWVFALGTFAELQVFRLAVRACVALGLRPHAIRRWSWRLERLVAYVREGV